MTTEAQFFSLRELAGPLRQVKESQKGLRGPFWELGGSRRELRGPRRELRGPKGTRSGERGLMDEKTNGISPSGGVIAVTPCQAAAHEMGNR